MFEKLKTFTVTSETIRDGTCRLFKTKDGTKIAIAHDKDKMKVFEIDESKIPGE